MPPAAGPSVKTAETLGFWAIIAGFSGLGAKAGRVATEYFELLSVEIEINLTPAAGDVSPRASLARRVVLRPSQPQDRGRNSALRPPALYVECSMSKFECSSASILSLRCQGNESQGNPTPSIRTGLNPIPLIYIPLTSVLRPLSRGHKFTLRLLPAAEITGTGLRNDPWNKPFASSSHHGTIVPKPQTSVWPSHGLMTKPRGAQHSQTN